MQKNSIVPGVIDIIFGVQWGDEGKGKWVQYLSSLGQYDIIARFQGGANAGHTLYSPLGKKFIVHEIPSAIFQKDCTLLIASGCVTNPKILLQEIVGLKELGYDVVPRLYISERTIVVTPYAVMIDKAREILSGKKIGSTQSGISVAYEEHKARIALRMSDLFSTEDIEHSPCYVQYKKNRVQYLQSIMEDNEELLIQNEFTIEIIEAYERQWFDAIRLLKNMNLRVADVQPLITTCIKQGNNILAEGAQGGMLDITHGDYPFVTSSHTLPSEVCASLGVPPQCIGKIIGVMKWYSTKVGGGSFPPQFVDSEIENRYQELGEELGATTGRLRNCGGFDMPAFRKIVQMSGITHVIISKVDICPFDTIEITDSYIVNGHKMLLPPLHLNEVHEVVRVHHKSWKGIKTGLQELRSVPIELINFASYIKNEANAYSLVGDVKITYLGTGPRDKDFVLYEE